MSPWLEAALAAARAADEIARHYYRRSFAIRIKPDGSPATDVDIEAENAIRSILLGVFPDHGFYGEECGAEQPDAEYLWIVDPIDGTKSLVRGHPYFSTQIALMHRGELILGVSSAAMFDELAYAERGAGAYLNGERIRVSAVDEIKDTSLSIGNCASLALSPHWARLGKLIQVLYRFRGYGDFCHYHLLAAGRLDAVIETDIVIFDIAALTVIVQEAGGTVTELDGQVIGLHSQSILATSTPGLHQRLRQSLEAAD